MPSSTMLEDFEAIEMRAEETRIFLRRFGSGPAVLLLHGFPQTHLMWRSSGALLARRFTDARQSADGAPGSDWHPATDAQRARWAPRTALAISVASPKLARILLRLWHFSDALLCGCGGHQRPIGNSVWGPVHATLSNEGGR